ncbi:hypothetical protein NDU88_005649 [Pleurodeles waltl]|uniref:Uncharacterized protein n=1 Tax=Pleurodeles waltl TaxID=8319 RepID=A0AAV7WA60_PLEWA|nr:hypothetical protein NDU88_005649 [Pleurodeles waltl]
MFCDQLRIFWGHGLATRHDGRLKRVLREAAGLRLGTEALWGTENLLDVVEAAGGYRSGDNASRASWARDPAWTVAAWSHPGGKPGATTSGVFRSPALPSVARWSW